MNKYFTLTKTLIMCGLDIGNSKGKLSISRNLATIVSVVVIVALVLWLVSVLTAVMRDTIAAGGSAFVMVEQGMSVGMLAALIMGIPMVLSSFYVSSDTTTLLSLPVSLPTIAAARFTRCFIYDYSLVFIFCLPTFIAFGIATQASVLYWAIAIISFLVLPAVPLAYDAIVAMVLMRLFRRMHNKKLLTGIGSTASMVFVCVWVFLSMRTGSSDALGMSAMLASLSGIANIFPNLVFANAAIEQLSLINLLLFVLTSAAFVAAFLVLAKFIYFESVVGMSETSAPRKKMAGKSAEAFEQVSSPLASYTRIERRKIFRSTYLLQVYLSELLWPVIIAVSAVFSATSSPDSSMLTLVTSLPSMDGGMMFLVIFALAMSYLCSASNPASAIAISLEGVGISFTKTLPVTFRDIIVAKVRAGLPIDFLLGNILPLVVSVYCIIHGMSPLVLVVVVAAGLAGTVTVNYVKIMFDLNKPNFNWSDQSALGRKTSTIFAVLASIVLGIIIIVLSVLVWLQLGLTVIMGVVLCMVLSIALAIIARSAALSYGQKRLRQLP